MICAEPPSMQLAPDDRLSIIDSVRQLIAQAKSDHARGPVLARLYRDGRAASLPGLVHEFHRLNSSSWNAPRVRTSNNGCVGSRMANSKAAVARGRCFPLMRTSRSD